jgi:aerobic C4-dicarboxylate transport protein
VQVLVAIVLGVLVGHFFPKTGTALKPLGDAFISILALAIGLVVGELVHPGTGLTSAAAEKMAGSGQARMKFTMSSSNCDRLFRIRSNNG